MTIEDNQQMKKTIITENNFKKSVISVFFLLATISIYWLPRLDWLEHYIWIKIGISFVVFVIPGASLYGILNKNCHSAGEATIVGFSFSILLITVLGLAARYENLSFSVIKNIFLGLGIVITAIYLISVPRSWYTIKAGSFSNLMGLLPGILMTLSIALIVTNRILSEDDQIYVAYQLYFQKSANIGFNEIIFGYNQLSPSRFWLVSIPLMQAFLSSMAHESSLVLASGYYEPFLAILSAISLYQFARGSGLSKKMASLAIVLQFTFLILLSDYLHPGSPFLHQLGTDKAIAAFIIAPVFFSRFYMLFKDFNRNNLIIAILMSLCLSAVHPVIFAYAAFIAGLAILIAAKKSEFLKRSAIVGLILGLGLLPQVAIRMADHPSNKIYAADEALVQSDDAKQMISFWEGSNFYGFNPVILKARIPDQPLSINPLFDIFSGYAWLGIPLLSTVLAVKSFKKDILAAYLLASITLPTLAGIPLTGWLIGIFFTPWMLERTTWLYPFGVSAVFLLNHIKGALAKKTPLIKSKGFAFSALYLATLFCVGIIVLYMQENHAPDFQHFDRRSQRYEELSRLGMDLDKTNTTSFRIIGTDGINDFIPTFSVKGKLISYRPSDPTYSYFIPAAEHRQRMADRQAIFSDFIAPAEKLNILQKYQLKYLLIKTSELDSVKKLMNSYPEIFKKVFQTRNYLVIEVDNIQK